MAETKVSFHVDTTADDLQRELAGSYGDPVKSRLLEAALASMAAQEGLKSFERTGHADAHCDVTIISK